jgi:hypothetical protein
MRARSGSWLALSISARTEKKVVTVQLKPKAALQLIADVSPPATRPNFGSVVRKYKHRSMHAEKSAARSVEAP